MDAHITFHSADLSAPSLHIGILVERRYLVQPQPAGLCAALRARGHRVRLIDPQAAAYEPGDHDWLEGLDLIVARGRSWLLLSLLAWAETQGIPTCNRRAAVAAVHNKADMAVRLAGHVPIPQTLLGTVECLARHVPAASYPLILKPLFGDNCRGLQVVDIPDDLARLVWPEPMALAQRYLPSDGYDLKLYGIGDEFWAVRKPSPFERGARLPGGGMASADPQATLLPLTPALHELGRRCRDLFSLDLFGVDCVQTPDGPVVIEVNDFPNYTGVPQAHERLADWVIRRAQERGTT